MIPCRTRDLIKRIEAGETVTQQDVDRIARLQALDMAIVGREFVERQIQSEEQTTDLLRKALETI